MINTAKITIFIYLISFALLSCSSPKNISGTYYSKFPELGMFGTTIRLKPDSTLEYVIRGDVMYDSVTGHYQAYGNKVYVVFDKELPGVTRLGYAFSYMPLKRVTYPGDLINYQLLLYIGHNKLFAAQEETGRKITRERGYSRWKKYLFFGSNYYYRRYYYKRFG